MPTLRDRLRKFFAATKTQHNQTTHLKTPEELREAEARIESLSRVSLFSRLKKQDLARMADKAASRVYQAGEVLIREGQKDRSLFVITQGKVEVMKSLGKKEERSVAILGPMAYFGEMSLIDGLPRSASVVAREETHTLSLNHSDLYEEIKRSPDVTIHLLEMLSRRVRASQKMMSTLGTFLPICASCKKIREQDGSWTVIESYISNRSDTEFTHGICPECEQRLYGESLSNN